MRSFNWAAEHDMRVTFVDGLPGLGDDAYLSSLRTRGFSAFIRSQGFIARFSLRSGKVEWLIERSPVKYAKSTWKLPRRIDLSGSDFWCSEVDELIAEILPTEDGGLLVFGRNAETGKQVWEHSIPIPEAADWAEASPAWPGAQTEEVHAFLANDPSRLVLCLYRQTRRSGLSSPSRGINVLTLPPYACQTDATRFDPLTGKTVWRESFRDVRVGILERQRFSGVWSNSPKVGILDFETGSNKVLYETPHELGWPVRDALTIGVPWHSKKDVGVDWIDVQGNRVRQGAWRQSGVRSTNLHATESGLALQSNDQTLWWLGKEDTPLWSVRAKPYIYHVYCSPASNVFVCTDGRGGRLLGFDAASGRESLNIKPLVGGAAHMAKLPERDILVGTFGTSRTDCRAGHLFVLSMNDRKHEFVPDCRHLVGTWQNGAVCLAGSKGERLSVVDVHST